MDETYFDSYDESVELSTNVDDAMGLGILSLSSATDDVAIYLNKDALLRIAQQLIGIANNLS